jgi:hypothetical protein
MGVSDRAKHLSQELHRPKPQRFNVELSNAACQAECVQAKSDQRAAGDGYSRIGCHGPQFSPFGECPDSARMACRFFGGIFMLMGLLVMVGGAHVDKYHNLLHLVWGAFALGVSFLGETAAKRFCIASGAFYLSLAVLGLTVGNPVLSRAWYLGPMLLHTGDPIFHMVLGSVFLAMGLVSGRTLGHRETPGVAFGHGTVGQKVQRY